MPMPSIAATASSRRLAAWKSEPAEGNGSAAREGCYEIGRSLTSSMDHGGSRSGDHQSIMEGLVPGTIVLALGVGVLGGPDAVRLLLEETAVRSPLHDIFTCVLAMSVATAHVLGTVLLARFVSKARAGGGGAAAGGAPAATDPFVRMTTTVSAGAAFLAAACLLVGSGGLGALRLALDSSAKNPAAAAAVIAAAAGGFFPYTMRPLLRFVRVRGAGSRLPYALTQTVCLLLVALAVPLLFAPGGIGARRSLLADVSVAVAAVVGTVLVARFSRRARNADGAAPAPATDTDTRRLAKMTRGTSLAAVAFALASLIAISFAYAQPGREPDAGK